MANEEHLQILQQGVEVWNHWRTKNREVRPDFREANLSRMSLGRVDLYGADLYAANLSHAYLTWAGLSGARLTWANLSGANLGRATLHRTDLSGANLDRASLMWADLKGADLSWALLRLTRLQGADLSEAILIVASISEANLSKTNLSRSILGRSLFGNVDLSDVKGLDTVVHRAPSTVGIDTIVRSGGHIPEVFLQGAGVPDSFILYAASLTQKAIEYYSAFISYSGKDEEFAKQLHADLQSNGVRCWFAPEDLKIGDKFWIRIDESIQMHDKLLLILSEHSIASPWVEHEVETAREQEEEQNKLILFPVRLDDAVMESKTGWAAYIKRTRHIGDFRNWKSHDEYQKALQRLIGDLKAEA